MNDLIKSELNDHQLKRMLQMPLPPPTLVRQLEENLDNQIRLQAAHKKRWWYGGVAIVFLASAALIYVIFRADLVPAIIASAYNDVRKEEKLNGIIADYGEFFSRNGLNRLPPMLRVQFSKTCRLGAKETRHLRFVDEQFGTINLFIHYQPDERQFEGRARGRYKNQYWRIMRPRDNMFVLAVYDRDTAGDVIDEIVENLFAKTAKLLIFS